MKKIYKKAIAAVTMAAHILVISTACGSGDQNSNLSSNVATTTTTVQTPAPETTTVVSETTVSKVEQTTSKQETTTPVPETTVIETTIPETTVVTTPTPQWTEEAVNGTKYINTGCYSRAKAVLGSQTVNLYNVNDKVTVVAKTDTGYYKLDNGSFIHADYLSDNKVAITTTAQTTTKPQTEAPVASDVEQINTTIYLAKDDKLTWFYDDVDCTTSNTCYDMLGAAYEAFEYHKDKDVYKIRIDNKEYYVKGSDVILEDPVEPMYHYPFDFDAIKQYIIDDAVNNYGLVYSPDYKFEGSTWFPPTQVSPNTPAWLLKRDVEDTVESSFNNDTMKAGDTFNVYIEWVDVKEVTKDYIIKPDYDEGWLIYFLRG